MEKVFVIEGSENMVQQTAAFQKRFFEKSGKQLSHSDAIKAILNIGIEYLEKEESK